MNYKEKLSNWSRAAAYAGVGANQLLQDPTAHTATYYFSPTLVLRVTRLMFDRKVSKRARYAGFSVKIGVPNFREREQIKKFIRAKRVFPLKGFILTAVPKRRK